MTRRAPFAVLVAFVLVALAAAAWTAWWFALAERARDRIAAWAAPAPGKTSSAVHGGIETSGFPFSLDLRVADPVVAWRSGAMEAAWRGPRLVVRVRPWDLSSFALDLPGSQTLTVGAGGAAVRRIALAMASGRVRIEAAGGEARALEAAFEDLAATWAPGAPPATAERLVLAVAAADGGAARDVAVSVSGARPGGRAPPPFDATAAAIEATLRWVGPLADGESPGGRLEAWRAAGGAIEAIGLSVDWPPLAVEAEGAVALDRLLRPIGAFRVDVAGHRALLGALAASGVLEAVRAGIAAAALDLMATAGADGVPRLRVDVSIQDGLLRVGPLPLLPVGPVLPPPDGGP